MTKEKIESYKNKLQHEKMLVARDIKDFEKPVDLGNGDVDHFDEKTDEVEELSNRFGEENDLRKRLDEIDAALDKIENGNYGVCESCGGKIEEEIVDIHPSHSYVKSAK